VNVKVRWWLGARKGRVRCSNKKRRREKCGIEWLEKSAVVSQVGEKKAGLFGEEGRVAMSWEREKKRWGDKKKSLCPR